MLDPTFWWGLGVGLLASAVGAVLLWWVFSRHRRPEPGPADGPAAEVVGREEGGELPLAEPSVPTISIVVSESAPEAPPGSGRLAEPVPAHPTVSQEAWETALRSSERILLHLARQGSVGPGEVAPRGLCQAGMVESLGIRQGALTGILRRLEAAGVVSVSREHARGMTRRVKVYRLTPVGHQLVRQLIGRRPEAPGARSGTAGRRRGAPLPRVTIVPPPERTGDRRA